MHLCTAHDLCIASELPLPELPAAAGPADVTIRLAPPVPCPELDGKTASCLGNAAELRLTFKDVGTFVLRAGSKVCVHPVPGVSEQLLRTFVLGAGLGTLLHQRGCLVLHASGVAGPRGAVLFLGECGQGKSTTAASLHHRHGWSLLTDDVAALDERAPLRVLPGFPRCKLWPDAARSLGIDPSVLPLVHPLVDKRDHRIDAGFHAAALTLERMYVLAEGLRPEITRLAPSEALIETIRHRYLNRVLDLTNTRGRHFRQVQRLITQVPVFRLTRPRRLDLLPQVVAALANHCAATTTACGLAG